MVSSVKPEEFLIAAGQCFMFLLWSETAMRDLVALEEGGESMRKRYSEAFGKGPHPRDFSQRRMELGREDFGAIKERFLSRWPELKEDREIRDAIERVVLWRNVLGHANVQPFRGYLLYVPTEVSWRRIREYMRCHRCHEYLRFCKCEPQDQTDPLSIIVKDETLQTIYDDIQIVDIECFYPAAVSIDVAYQGVAWPSGEGGYLLKENRYSGH